LSPRQPIPSGPPAATTSGGGGGDDGSEGEGSGSGGDRKKGNATAGGAKGEKRASRKETKRNNHSNKAAAAVVTEVSLPTTVVNRVHVDKDNLAQDMDGVLRALHGELERLGNHEPQYQQQQSTRGGGLRRHRRSKSIDQLAGHQALKPELKGDHKEKEKEKEKEKGSKAEAPAFAFPLVTTTRQDKPVSKLHTSAAYVCVHRTRARARAPMHG
jgi:hypothetical protein